jgi:hypothetical protein
MRQKSFVIMPDLAQSERLAREDVGENPAEGKNKFLSDKRG